MCMASGHYDFILTTVMCAWTREHQQKPPKYYRRRWLSTSWGVSTYCYLVNLQAHPRAEMEESHHTPAGKNLTGIKLLETNNVIIVKRTVDKYVCLSRLCFWHAYVLQSALAIFWRNENPHCWKKLAQSVALVVEHNFWIGSCNCLVFLSFHSIWVGRCIQ